MKQYNYTEFKQAGFDIELPDAKEAIDLANEVSQFFRAVPVFSVSEYEGKEYFEHAAVRLVTGDALDIQVAKGWKGKYSFHSQAIHTLKNIKHNDKVREAKKLTEPKQVGVLTRKKIEDWIRYETELYNLLKIENDKNRSEIETFLSSLEGLPVHWWNNNKSGEIIKNGIKLSFTIGETYVSKKLEIYYEVPDSLSSFLSLSDNKYKPVKADS
jgi:hypothetical protein